MVSRQQAIVAALVDLLQAQTDDTLTAVLDGLGIAQERRPERHQDNRRCRECGNGWVRHNVLAAQPSDGHAWDPIERSH